MGKKNSSPATKEDVKKIVSEAVGELAAIVKVGFDDVYKRFDDIDKRFDDVYKQLHNSGSRISLVEKNLQESEERLKQHFDVVAENIHQDIAGANADEVSLVKQKQENLEERLVVVEEKVGV